LFATTFRWWFATCREFQPALAGFPSYAQAG
jgi:hypothetical protein